MLSIAIPLFIVLDPFGNMVTLNTLLRAHAPAKRRRIMLRESLIALAILLVCVLGGGALLRVFEPFVVHHPPGREPGREVGG